MGAPPSPTLPEPAEEAAPPSPPPAGQAPPDLHLPAAPVAGPALEDRTILTICADGRSMLEPSLLQNVISRVHDRAQIINY